MAKWKAGDTHSAPLVSGENTVTQWYCGFCYSPLIGYDPEDAYKFCPTCGERLDHPGHERSDWKRITIEQRDYGQRLMARFRTLTD